MESVSVPATLSERFDRDKVQLENALAELGAQIQKLDPTLAGAVSTAQHKIGFQLEKLRRKTGRLWIRKCLLASTSGSWKICFTRISPCSHGVVLPAVSGALGHGWTQRAAELSAARRWASIGLCGFRRTFLPPSPVCISVHFKGS